LTAVILLNVTRFVDAAYTDFIGQNVKKSRLKEMENLTKGSYKRGNMKGF